MSSEWPKCRLGDLVNVKHGFAFKSEFFSEYETPFQLVTPGNFAIGGGFQQGKGKYYCGEIPSEYVLKKGDVVVTMTDLSRGADTLGYAAVIPETNNTTWLHNQRVGLIQLNKIDAIDRGFVHYLLRSSEYRHWIVASATGSTVKHTAPSRICNFEFMLPPIGEQKGIATILGSLDDRITILRETNATLEAIAQALFKSWFVDFDPVRAKQQGKMPEGMDEATAALFPDSFEESELGLVPKGWRIGKLEDILLLQRGFDLPASDRKPGDYPIIAASGPSGTHNLPMAKAPGVITGRSGVLGRVFLELEDYWPLNTTLWVKEFRAASPCYAFEVLSLLDFASFNAGSAVPTLNRNHVHSLPYLIPNRVCVDAYESLAISLHQRVRENLNQAQSLASLRDTLLPRLISGQLRITEVEEAIKEVTA